MQSWEHIQWSPWLHSCCRIRLSPSVPRRRAAPRIHSANSCWKCHSRPHSPWPGCFRAGVCTHSASGRPWAATKPGSSPSAAAPTSGRNWATSCSRAGTDLTRWTADSASCCPHSTSPAPPGSGCGSLSPARAPRLSRPDTPVYAGSSCSATSRTLRTDTLWRMRSICCLSSARLQFASRSSCKDLCRGCWKSDSPGSLLPLKHTRWWWCWRSYWGTTIFHAFPSFCPNFSYVSLFQNLGRVFHLFLVQIVHAIPFSVFYGGKTMLDLFLVWLS